MHQPSLDSPVFQSYALSASLSVLKAKAMFSLRILTFTKIAPAMMLAFPSLASAQPAALPAENADVGSCLQSRDPKAVVEACTSVISHQQRPEMVLAALLRRAEARSRQDDAAGAIADYSAALEREGSLPMALVSRGALFDLQGQSQKAIADFDQAIRLKPDLDIAYSLRGSARSAAGEFAAALQDFATAIELNPRLATAFRSRALTYRKMGEIDLAIKDYDAAIKLDPGGVSAYHGRRIAYEQRSLRDHTPLPTIVEDPQSTGLTADAPIRLVTSEGTAEAVATELAWIRQRHPAGARTVTQSLLEIGGRKVDRLEVELPNLQRHVYYFDVTEALGMPK